jgi:hypothetical protein
MLAARRAGASRAGAAICGREALRQVVAEHHGRKLPREVATQHPQPLVAELLLGARRHGTHR